jgi:hypothetical protein
MQIPDIPGANLRGLGYLLAGALAETGDLPAAEQACAATLAQARDAGDLITLGDLLRIMADLDLQAGRTGDAAPHLREAAQLSLQTGAWLMTLNVLEGCGHLCAATGRPADAVTVWAASDTFSQQGGIEDLDTDPWVRRGQEARRNAREALGPDRARAAEQRGAAMSPATAAEYALLLTAPDPPPPAGPGPGRRAGSAPGNRNSSPWSPRAAPTRRSPPSCTSASAPSAPTWTGSGTRPAAAAAPT